MAILFVYERSLTFLKPFSIKGEMLTTNLESNCASVNFKWRQLVCHKAHWANKRTKFQRSYGIK